MNIGKKVLPTQRLDKLKNLLNLIKGLLQYFFFPIFQVIFNHSLIFRKSGSIPLSTSSIFIIREIQKKQAWISEQNKEDGFGSKDFVGRFSHKSDPQLVAKDILKVLEIDPLNYSTENPIREWIDKAESNGIFVSEQVLFILT
ncbi:MAG: hypothetical protein U5L96_09235 [Owenweeksia sp.]|nr:hypothetical protein [Owenweeksia sp.]